MCTSGIASVVEDRFPLLPCILPEGMRLKILPCEGGVQLTFFPSHVSTICLSVAQVSELLQSSRHIELGDVRLSSSALELEIESTTASPVFISLRLFQLGVTRALGWSIK